MFAKIVTAVLLALGSMVAGGASVGCVFIVLDEPEAPKAIIEG